MERIILFLIYIILIIVSPSLVFSIPVPNDFLMESNFINIIVYHLSIITGLFIALTIGYIKLDNYINNDK